MLSILSAILCVLQNLLLAILWGGAMVINAVVLSISGLAQLVLLLLPSMPDVPSSGAPPEALGWLAWFYPVEAVLAGFSVMLLCWAAFLAVRIALRWVKAL